MSAPVYRYVTVTLPAWAASRLELQSPDTARKAIAHMAGQHHDPSSRCWIPSAFFHYPQGNTRGGLPGLSPFRFYTRPGRIGLYALGSHAVELLEDYGLRLGRLLGEHFGEVCDVATGGGYVKARKLDGLVPYRIHTLQVAARNDERIADGHPWYRLQEPIRDADLVRKIEDVIRSGIERQADVLGLSLSESPHVHVHGIKRMLMAPDKVRSVLCAVDVDVLCDLDLGGPWHVGAGCAKGRGELRHARK